MGLPIIVYIYIHKRRNIPNQDSPHVTYRTVGAERCYFKEFQQNDVDIAVCGYYI